MQDENKSHKVLDKFMTLFLRKRFLGKVDDQTKIKTIGKKLIHELNVHARRIKQSKDRITRLVGKPEEKPQAEPDDKQLKLMQDISKE